MMASLNWQMIINFILFAMIVTAFTFSIWSYIKTNAIKNSNSPSVKSLFNDNNTYVNNIASAPNVISAVLLNPTQTYKLKSTDNGSTIIPISLAIDNRELALDCSDVNNINGFYINVISNSQIIGVETSAFIITLLNSNFGSFKCSLTAGENVTIGFNISDINTSINNKFFVSGNYTILP
jgi:hypothetical protein